MSGCQDKKAPLVWGRAGQAGRKDEGKDVQDTLEAKILGERVIVCQGHFWPAVVADHVWPAAWAV